MMDSNEASCHLHGAEQMFHVMTFSPNSTIFWMKLASLTGGGNSSYMQRLVKGDFRCVFHAAVGKRLVFFHVKVGTDILFF